MKSLFPFGVFALVSLGLGVAQEPLLFPLHPISRPVIPGDKRCPPFFAVVRYSETSEEQIIFAYKLPDGSIKGDAVPSSRAVVNLVDGTPTYEKTTTPDGPGARFRLSQAEYDKAQACLPKRTIIMKPTP